MAKIDEVLRAQGEQAAAFARMQQWQETTHERIFGGQQPGMIQYLHAADEKLAETIRASNKELMEALTAFKASQATEIGTIKTDVSELKVQKRLGKAYAAGAVGFGTTLGYLIKAGLLKVGIHLP
jgi:hypothetical protein